MAEASPEALKVELKQIRQKIANLRSDIQRMRRNMIEYKQKRDEYNEKVKDLAEELRAKRKLRDENNSKVSFYKEIRAGLRDKRKDLLNQLSQLRENLPKPAPKGSRKIKDLIDKLEWRLQTVPMTIEEENSIVDRIRKLEEQLYKVKEQEEKYKQYRKIRNELDKVTQEIQKYHKLVLEHAKASQEYHEQIIKLREELSKYKEEADKYHNNLQEIKSVFSAKLEDLTKLEERRRELYGKVKELMIKQAAEKAAKKIQREREMLESKAKVAMDKLQRGEQLTFEEFVILQRYKELEQQLVNQRVTR